MLSEWPLVYLEILLLLTYPVILTSAPHFPGFTGPALVQTSLALLPRIYPQFLN